MGVFYNLTLTLTDDESFFVDINRRPDLQRDPLHTVWPQRPVVHLAVLPSGWTVWRWVQLQQAEHMIMLKQLWWMLLSQPCVQDCIITKIESSESAALCCVKCSLISLLFSQGCFPHVVFYDLFQLLSSGQKDQEWHIQHVLDSCPQLCSPSCPVSCSLSDTDYLKYLFPQFVKSNLYHLCYTAIGQRISICNYWNGETPRIAVSVSWHTRSIFLNLSNITCL